MIAGIILRFFQGLGDSMVSTAGYSIITIEFPLQKEKYIGYCQAAVGIGLMMGPIVGQALYTYFNFQKTFYIFAGALGVGMLIIMFIIPNKLNHADEIMSKSEIDLYFERLRSTDGASNSFVQPNSRVLMRSDAKTSLSREVTYWMFLRNRRAMMSVLSAVLAMVFMLFFESILTVHLIKDMELSENTAGKLISIH
jgi:MFS family permease